MSWGNIRQIFFLKFLHICMCVHIYASVHLEIRDNFTQVLSTTWVPGIELWLLGLPESTFLPGEPSQQPQHQAVLTNM